eukprot:2814600-Pyramimonas_sp.AAC.1
MSKVFEQGAASGSGEGRTEEARMQGHPWEGCPSLLCGLTVRTQGPWTPKLVLFWAADCQHPEGLASENRDGQAAEARKQGVP